MGFFETLKEVITNKPSTLREPVFVKEFNEDNKQLSELKELLRIAPEEAKKQIEQDIKLLSYGMVGERNVAYELKNSHMPILILHDLFLEYNDLQAQIDFVVIAQRFILVIECKNLVGDISISSDGDFVRYFKGASGKVYKKEGMYSPIVQNERHVALLEDILMKEKSFNKKGCKLIKHIVTVANPKAVINSKYASKDIKQHIIKHDQLINKLKELQEANKDGNWFSEEIMYGIANDLLKYNGTYTVNYERKYGVSLHSCDDKNMDLNADCSEQKTVIENKEIVKETELVENVEEVGKTEIVEKLVKIDSVEKVETIEKLEESELYKELKQYRYNKSKEENNKPYFVYNNLQLEALVTATPKTIEELKLVNGFGPVKCEKYGQDIIEIVKKNL